MAENDKVSYDKNASFESLTKEQQVQSILDKLEARKDRKNHPFKHAVKDFIAKISSRKNDGKVAYDKNAPFESLNDEQQVQKICDMIEERKARKNHPVKFALKDFMQNATKKFKSGANNAPSVVPPSNVMLQNRNKSNGR